MKTFIIDIDHPGEPAAGILDYYEEVVVNVRYDPGGEPGEFESQLQTFLEDWFFDSEVVRRL